MTVLLSIALRQRILHILEVSQLMMMVQLHIENLHGFADSRAFELSRHHDICRRMKEA